MCKDREGRMGELKQQIEAGEYLVDPTAVADAIVRRLSDAATGPTPLGLRVALTAPSACAATVRTRARTRPGRRGRR